jgi:hypothetical protein
MIGAAKKKSISLPGLAALRLVLLLVVALCLPETRVWGFAATPQPASGVFESASPLSVGEFTTVIGYYASGSSVAPKGIPKVTDKGLTRVESHLDDVLKNQGLPREFQAGERAMLDRLRSGQATKQDIEFYMHELKESAVFRRTGDLRGAHQNALDFRRVTERDLFHPEVIQQNPQIFNESWR